MGYKILMTFVTISNYYKAFKWLLRNFLSILRYNKKLWFPFYNYKA